MKQISLATTGFTLVTKLTRKREFLDEMNLVGLIQPHASAGTMGRPPFAVLTMLRIHFMQQWFGPSDPAMEEALHDVPLYREFAGLDAGATRMPDESTILRFCHLLQEHDLSPQLLAAINATLATKGLMLWHPAMRPGKRRALDQSRGSHQLIEQLEQIKASIRAKVEHPFRVIKRQFGLMKVRYRG